MNKIKLFGSEKPRAAAGKAKWLVLACLLMPMTMSGQEMIRAFDNHTTNFSLVRLKIPLEDWIVYNQSGDTSFFGKINTSGTTFDIMLTEQQIFVKDMVMAGDTLYFCGQKYNSTTNQYDAIMGYFKTSTMPSTNVYYVQIDSLSVMRKIDYYKSYTTKHVVMVGTARNGDDVIVDSFHDYQMHSNFHFWCTSWARIDGLRARFDDVEICGSNVVISSYVPDSLKSYLFFIEKSPLVSVPFYVSPSVRMKTMAGVVKEPILLKRGDADTLFAAFVQSAKLYMYRYKNLNLDIVKTVSLPHASCMQLPDDNTLLDVQSDREKKYLNLLVRNTPAFGISTYQIFNLPMNVVNNAVIAGSQYSFVTLHSLGESRYGHALVVGKNTSNKLAVYRFLEGTNTDGCIDHMSQYLNNSIVTNYNPISKITGSSQKSQVASIMPTSIIVSNISTECQ